MALPASLQTLWTRIAPYADRLAVWRGYEDELTTLAIYGIGVALYATLVYTFYNAISRRKPFHLSLSDRPKWTGRLSRTFERIFVFPVTSFVYFTFLAISLFVLAKSQTTQGILLVAMAVIMGIRVAVYVSEGISNDLAKLVPLSLLGVLLVDPGYLTLQLAWTRLGEAMQLWPLLGRYFLLFMALEAVMGSIRWAVLRTSAQVGEVAVTRVRRGKDERVSVPVKGAPEKDTSPKVR